MNGQIVLFSERDIEARVEAVARAIASAPAPPEILVPVLIGAFVFAADLLRALSRAGLDLPVEPIWLASYGDARQGAQITVRVGPGERMRGKPVLLVDGVLDHGHTLAAARKLLLDAGAAAVTTAVVVDKRRPAAPLRADHACFSDVDAFVVGYGMDDAGLGRGLSHIVKAD